MGARDRIVTPLHRAALGAAITSSRVALGVGRRLQAWATRRLRIDDAEALTAQHYAGAARYREGWHAQLGLFDFEEAALAADFPPPPARLLVPGLGGGREALALRAHGYIVAGCEPDAAMAATARSRLGGDADAVVVAPLQALAADPTLLAGPWDGVLIGWGAWGHVYRRADRVAALRALAARVPARAPLLLSFTIAALPGLRGEAHDTDALRGGKASPGVDDDARRLRFGQGTSVHVRLGERDLRDEAAAGGWAVASVVLTGGGYPHARLRRGEDGASAR